MNHKKKIAAILLILAIGVSAAGIYFYTNASLAGTLTQNSTTPKDNRSVIDFRASVGDILTFKLSAEIEEGEVEFQIIDGEQNIIASFGPDSGEQKLVVEDNDVYEVVALSTEMVGKFRLKVYKK